MIDPVAAAALGFRKPEKYAAVERERRWLCAAVPDLRPLKSEAITDLYVENSRLRLRQARQDDGSVIYRLSKKGDLRPDQRLISTLYLTQAEFDLFVGLPGRTLRKTRFYYADPSVTLTVDRFEGALDGLIMAEAEFGDDAAMATFADPEFAVREVTWDQRYTGGALVIDGVPADCSEAQAVTYDANTELHDIRGRSIKPLGF